MQIIPVIDLKAGQVVRAVGGRRNEYRPIESRLCGDAYPVTVARALIERLGLKEAYVADLDAIEGDEPAWDDLWAMLDCGLRLWVDAGIRDVPRAIAMADFRAEDQPLCGIVAGLESLDSPRRLAEIAQVIPRERLVFSLDLKSGQPLVGGPGWQGMSPEQIALESLEARIERIIVLDLARVGEGQGVGTEAFCRWLRREEPTIELTAGGGVRGLADLESLSAAGCDAALVASALHDGRLGPAEVSRFK